MNDALFDIPESKSPRLIWLENHQVKTHHAPHCEEAPWSAWLPANEAEQGLPMDPEACGYGMTQDEAITDLAKRAKIKLWNEETL